MNVCVVASKRVEAETGFVRRFVLGLCAGPWPGRDRVLVDSAPLTKSSTCSNRRQKYTLGFWHILAARGDARPPRIRDHEPIAGRDRVLAIADR